MGHKTRQTQLYAKVRMPRRMERGSIPSRILELLDQPRTAEELRTLLVGASYHGVAVALHRLRQARCIVLSHLPPVPGEKFKKRTMLVRTGQRMHLVVGSSRQRLYDYLNVPRSTKEVAAHLSDVPECTLSHAIRSLVSRGGIRRYKENLCS